MPTLAYQPRHHFLPFHQRTRRWAAMVCHRRAGKTVTAVNELIIRALYTPKINARYGYVAPFRAQAKEIAWAYLKQYAAPFLPTVKDIRESELRVRLINGSWVTLYGADNPNALRGVFFDGIVLDEFGDMRPSLWGEVILPTLSDRKGWALVIGTSKGHNQFHKVIHNARTDPLWYHLTLPASQSGIIDSEELAILRSQMSPEQYQAEMECSFEAPIQGTYYAQTLQILRDKHQIPAHHDTRTQTPLYDPAHKVNIAMDLGRRDSTACWFWQPQPTSTHPNRINIIDYYESQGQHLNHYFEAFDKLPYHYDTIYVPHDAVAKTLATERSTIEQLIDHYRPQGVKIDKVPNLARQHGIDAARLVLLDCWFDTSPHTGTQTGLEALAAYQRKFSDLTMTFSQDPWHNWASDAADAFRYFALVASNALNSTTTRVPNAKTARVTSPYKTGDQHTLQALFEDREQHAQRTHARILRI